MSTRDPLVAWSGGPGTWGPTNRHALDSAPSQRIEINYFAVDQDRANEIDRKLFTPCMPADPLLEAVSEAAGNATSRDVVLLSPASSGLDQSRNHQYRAARLCNAVKSIGWGGASPNPNIHGLSATRFNVMGRQCENATEFASGFFLRKNPEAK